MRLVDDDGVVGAQVGSVCVSASKMPSVISLTEASLRQPVLEPHLEAHHLAQRRLQLLGDALGHAAGRNAPRLGVADQLAALSRLGVRACRAPCCSAILGNCVVLPEPVSPQTITTWCSRMAASISCRRAETGRDSGNSMCSGAEDKGELQSKSGNRRLSRAARPPAPPAIHVHRLQLHLRALVPLGRALHPQVPATRPS